MGSFGLVAYASLEASRTLLQQLLACLNFTLDSEDLFYLVDTNEKTDFYKLWQQHRQLKVMEMSEVDLILRKRNIYINFEPTHKIH